jgi:hypothetical protein
VGHRVRFNSDACDSEFLAFNESGASPAKRVQYSLPASDSEPLDILADEMRWERKDEAIPIVGRPIDG